MDRQHEPWSLRELSRARQGIINLQGKVAQLEERYKKRPYKVFLYGTSNQSGSHEYLITHTSVSTIEAADKWISKTKGTLALNLLGGAATRRQSKYWHRTMDRHCWVVYRWDGEDWHRVKEVQ